MDWDDPITDYIPYFTLDIESEDDGSDTNPLNQHETSDECPEDATSSGDGINLSHHVASMGQVP
jgi:hypothetical protein